ncbi:ATP-binding cassette domain-containing protein [Deinococcus cellulosilyticus]|uniref:Sugar ABC transporter ATP-binding protein n=1 Tax=Deinococcus cellulosilyticus (strain DSM 18568 / NBRC 106333 / KACC 11606 / 5516J-15) TaxID=1223518 RepID=A0A511N3G0_DEIC1|nr:ATP-binding cassette domain-containing protein [Deinococcus cellulosilyticus]GEM46988.1 sugar ABC transporter ATP-binding protein [Deinococcus cellulosilyticus NBRC 106333 = KACC 11606]
MQKLVEMQNISKRFGGVQSLDDVSVDLMPGEVVGLLGHNGAGKSTLIKILSGAYTADSGKILVNGQEAHIRSPKDAQRYGIETIYQNLALADNLDVAANIFLGRELLKGPTLDEDHMEYEARQVLDRLKVHLPTLKKPVLTFSGGQRQAIAIARAIYFKARVLIMDEPTAALGPQETRQVGELIKALKSEGVGIFLISHDMHDVFDLSDRVSVMKNGKLVGTVRTQDVTQDEVLGMIISGAKPAVMMR